MSSGEHEGSSHSRTGTPASSLHDGMAGHVGAATSHGELGTNPASSPTTTVTDRTELHIGSSAEESSGAALDDRGAVLLPSSTIQEQARSGMPDAPTQSASRPIAPPEMPPGLQNLVMGVMAAMDGPVIGHGPLSASPGSYASGGPRGSSVPLPTLPGETASSEAAPDEQPEQPGRPDPRVFFRQQFAHLAEAMRQTPASRPDPERAQELLRGLKDPGQTVLRRLVRICEVEDSRGETNEGVQCGICLDTITEIFEREQGEGQDVCNPADEKATGEACEAVDIGVDGALPCSAGEDSAEMQDVEQLLDGRRSTCKSEDTNFRAFPCHHFFCQECLLPWLSTHTTCPTCRLDIDPHSVTLRRPVSRQQRDTSLRPGPTRSSALRNTRPAAWRMLRLSPTAPPVPVPNAGTDATLLPGSEGTTAAADRPEATSATGSSQEQMPHGVIENSGESGRAEGASGADAPVTGSGPSSNHRPPFPVQRNNPMEGLTFMFLSGEGPSGPSNHSGPPVTGQESGSSHTPSGIVAGRPAHGPPPGAFFFTVGAGPPPYSQGGMLPTPDRDTSATTNATAGPQPGFGPGAQHGPAPSRMPPLILAFNPNMNPFGVPEDMAYIRSDAVWNPPSSKNSLRQWLHKRERDLDIVCDDPHCRYVRPCATNDLADEFVQLNAFSTYDAMCDHRYHASCLKDASRASGNYQPLDEHGSRAAMRCLLCRKQGWTAMGAVGIRSRSTSVASGQQ